MTDDANATTTSDQANLNTAFTVDLKRYILLELGYPNVEVELCDEQLDRVIADTLSDFLRFNALNLLRFWKIALTNGVTEYTMPSDLRVVRDVTVSQLNNFDALFGSDAIVNPLFLRNSKEAYQDILTFWISEAAYNTWRTVYGLNTTWDVVEGNKKIRIYPLPRGNEAAVIKGTYVPVMSDIGPQMLGTKDELFRRMCLARAMQILGRIRGKRVSGYRSSEGNVILDGDQLRQEGDQMLKDAREELQKAGRPLGFYRG